ncbi:MAG: hypothetical protein ACLFP6_08970 [Spirochaetaceae bacterium]
MKRYRIKCEPGRSAYLDILAETGKGFHVRIVREQDGYETVTESFMEHHLFDLCLSTAYISELSGRAASVA